MKKTFIVYILCVITFCLFIVGYYKIYDKNRLEEERQQEEKRSEALKEKRRKAKQVPVGSVHSNYEICYKNDEVHIFFIDGTSESIINEIVESINGNITDIDKNLNRYNIKIPKKNNSELERMKNSLEKNENIKFVILEKQVRKKKYIR